MSNFFSCFPNFPFLFFFLILSLSAFLSSPRLLIYTHRQNSVASTLRRFLFSFFSFFSHISGRHQLLPACLLVEFWPLTCLFFLYIFIVFYFFFCSLFWIFIFFSCSFLFCFIYQTTKCAYHFLIVSYKESLVIMMRTTKLKKDKKLLFLIL
jgi:hypothetical protein